MQYDNKTLTMSVNDLLTQDEINALLSGQSSDDVIIRDNEKQSENQAAEDWGECVQIPALSVLNRRYSQLFRDIFFNLLRKEITVSNCGVHLIKLPDYLDSLYVPSSVNQIKINPLNGSALFVFDPDLVFMIVDNYFGGDGRYQANIKKTSFSPMETRLIGLLLEKVFVSLKRVWEPVMPLEFELLGSFVNSQLINIDNPDETIVVSSFCVEIENTSGDQLDCETQKGELQLSMPYSLLGDILGTDV